MYLFTPIWAFMVYWFNIQYTQIKIYYIKYTITHNRNKVDKYAPDWPTILIILFI